MSLDVAGIVERARAAGGSSSAAEAPGADRDRLKRIAAEFESMLLVQMLKDMRRAGSWEEEGGDGAALGAESLFEMLDVELASHLARVRGMGLSSELEEAFDRLHPDAGATPPLPAPLGQLSPRSVEARMGADAAALGTRHGSAASAASATSNPVTAALRAAADAAVGAPKAVAEFVRPVAGAVTSAFGWRQDPFTNAMKFHQGVDLRAAYGQEVVAAASGRVVFSGEQGGYGTTVVLRHEDGTQTRYAHLSARQVEKGDRIAAGEPLGRAGQSGRATGTHLHFEVIAPDGRRIAPEQWTEGRSPVGNSPGVTVARSIKDRGTDAD